MDSLGKLQQCQHPLRPSLHLFPSFPKPASSLRFGIRRATRLSCLSSSSDSFRQITPVYRSSLLQILNPVSSSILRIAYVAVAAAGFCFLRFSAKPAIAALPPPATVESANESLESELSCKEKERVLEEQLANNPNDIEALRSLMEVRLKARKFPEAIDALDRLIGLEPDDLEWLVLKANIYSSMGDSESARNEFERVLAKDPFQIEAYHGLVMLTETSDTGSLKGIRNRVEEIVENCKKEKGKSEERDFKLLMAQIKVMEGSYAEALEVYQELEREEPKDFRPYLCQGIVFTLLRKNDEAEKQFETFRRLVPKNHPYKEYFDENMLATKHFIQQLEREASDSKI